MIVEPTCIFCQGKLGLGQPSYSKMNGQALEVISETATCRKCRISQTFAPNGQPLRYNFKVGPYILEFDLKRNQFSIREMANYHVVLMSCDYIPKDFTPQTVSLERVKTLILFS